jgi:mono/diheme cytochrome c family protein
MKIYSAGVVALALTGGALLAQDKPSSTLSPAEQDGQKIFQTRCAMCHVKAVIETELKEGASTARLAPGLSKASSADEKAIREKILQGGPRMPGYRWSLQTEQIDHVVAYIRTLDKPLTRIFSTNPGQ